jgi:vesicle coat complex subunit
MSPSLVEPGKPHIFLLDDPELEKNHVKAYTKSPEAMSEYAEIVDVLFRIVLTKQLSDVSLHLLAQRMRSRFKVVYEQAGRRLVQLSHYFDKAGSVLLVLMSDSNATIRVRVIQSLWTQTPPPELTDLIIRKGLGDKSSMVRQFAISRIGQLKLKHLASDLRAILLKEKNEKLTKEARYALQSLGLS